MKKFYIYLTFDIDQDFAPNTSDYYNRNNVLFDGFSEGLPIIIDALKGLPFSTFIRADYQIYSIYGSYDYLLKKYPNIPNMILNNNGEINWHIHLYEKIMNSWAQIKENDTLIETFLKDYNEVKKINLINHKIVRIGECVMNNDLMCTMNKLGIKIDSTALPGRYRDDDEKHFDWRLTTNKIYHPTIKDYQINGDFIYNLYEVPMTTIYMKAQYDKESYKRYINLSFKSDVLFQNLEEYVNRNDYLVSITHPYEILNKGSHGLISYSINTFLNNLGRLIDIVNKAGKEPVFCKLGGLIHETNPK